MSKQKRATQPDVFRAINALRRMVRGLRSAAESVERELRISAAQLFVLSELAQVPDQSVKDLAGTTMTTHSTVSQVVGQLIDKKLVTRTADASDARRSVLRVTRLGTNLLRRSPRAIQEDLIDGFGWALCPRRCSSSSRCLQNPDLVRGTKTLAVRALRAETIRARRPAGNEKGTSVDDPFSFQPLIT